MDFLDALPVRRANSFSPSAGAKFYGYQLHCRAIQAIDFLYDSNGKNTGWPEESQFAYVAALEFIVRLDGILAKAKR